MSWKIWQTLPTRLVAERAEGVASSPSMAALSLLAERRLSRCHSWVMLVAEVRPMLEISGVCSGLVLVIASIRSSVAANVVLRNQVGRLGHDDYLELVAMKAARSRMEAPPLRVTAFRASSFWRTSWGMGCLAFGNCGASATFLVTAGVCALSCR